MRVPLTPTGYLCRRGHNDDARLQRDQRTARYRAVSAAALAPPQDHFKAAGMERVRALLASAGAVVLGAAPHVLHHAAPLPGTTEVTP